MMLDFKLRQYLLPLLPFQEVPACLRLLALLTHQGTPVIVAFYFLFLLFQYYATSIHATLFLSKRAIACRLLLIICIMQCDIWWLIKKVKCYYVNKTAAKSRICTFSHTTLKSISSSGTADRVLGKILVLLCSCQDRISVS